MTTVSVIGTGYVGLVSAACFAELGHQVTGYDVDAGKIARLSRGECTIYEPGLEPLLKSGIAGGRLRFTADLKTAVQESDVLFVCVGTPQAADGRADLSQVEAVARNIAAVMDGYKLVVEKSTVPVKTAQWIRKTIAQHGGKDFSVASNPEFLREGVAVNDFMRPERIVLGVDDERAKKLLLELYAKLECPKLIVDVETAEIIKHASNSFLALKISYINMIADLCEAVGADVAQVAEGMGLDSRIGAKFLSAGIGYGGSCFPKDVRAFRGIAEAHGVDFDLLRVTDAINEGRTNRAVKRLRDALWVLQGKTVAFWGLAFKPGTDDVREAASIKLAKALQAEGVRLRGWDPEAAATFRQAAPDIQIDIFPTPEAAAEQANAVVVLTEWPDLQKVDMAKVRGNMATPILYDARNFLDPQACRDAGFVYLAVGRPGVETHLPAGRA